MAEQELAAEEEIEQARDTMTEEALIAFFAAQMLLDGDEGDGPELALAVEQWLVRGARRFWQLYSAGYRGLGQLVVPSQSNADPRARDRDLRAERAGVIRDSGVAVPGNTGSTDFTPSAQTVRDVTRTVKAMRRTLRADQRAEQRGQEIGHHLTPEAAARGVSNQATGLISMDVAEELGSNAIPGITIQKTWITRQDDRVRELHEKLNGRTKKLGSDFWRWPQTGQVLAFPGDSRAPLDATANCRCFLLLSVG